MLAKKFISMMILLVALVVVSSNSFAQSMPGDKAGRVSDMLYRKLNLTDDQYSKIYSSLLGYYEKEPSMKGKETASMDDWKSVNNSITSDLNKDQQAIYSGMSEKSITSAANWRPRRKVTKAPETNGMTEDKTKTTVPSTTTKTTTPPSTTKDMTKSGDPKIKNDVKKKSDK